LESTVQDLRESRARVVKAGDAVRRRIERDLHDGVQQQLTAIRMKLELARETATAGTPERDRLEDLCGDIERALADLRELARGIFPGTLADHGLLAALRSATAGSPLRVRIEGDLSNRRLAPELEAALYFCCLEVLEEVAPDSEVGIDLVDSGEELVLALRVDGAGVDPAGLTGLRDRLAAFGGVVADSRNAAGTVVNCSVPIVTVS
jgi:signal transduction histidine kinase